MHGMAKMMCAVLMLSIAIVFAPAMAFADEGATGEVVKVASAQDFNILAKRVAAGDSMRGVVVLQEADVDFKDEKAWFEPIGTGAVPFEGTFDGQGHEIRNATVYKLANGFEQLYLGLFGRANGATFRNMAVSGLSVSINTTSVAFEAMLCPVMDSCTVENCTIQGVVGAESGSPSLTMGGLCANATNCTMTGLNVDYARGVKDYDQFSPSYPSAILARTATGCTFSSCNVTGSITNAGSVDTGSLVARLVDSTIEGCTSDASIVGSVSSGGYAGGLVGYAEKSTIAHCVNNGTITCTGSNASGYVAGLVGYLGRASSLTDSANEADISMTVSISTYDGSMAGDSQAAGLVGLVAGNSKIERCVNAGAVSSDVTAMRHAYCYAGGLVGKGSYATISDCYNCAPVRASARTTASGWLDSNCYVGGIAANLDEQVDVVNCYHAASLEAEFLSESSNEAVIDGVCPVDGATYKGCYYYRCACGSKSAHGTPLTARDMMKKQSFEKWDFSSTWVMDGDSYLLPVLQWEAGGRPALLEPETVLENVTIAPLEGVSYSGQAIEPKVKVTGDGEQLVAGRDYLVSFENNVNAGKATVLVECWGAYVGEASASFKIAKADNPMKAKAAKTSFKTSSKKEQGTKIKVKNAQGAVKMSSSSKKVKVNAKGEVTIAKGFKGKAKITVKAGGNANYLAATKVITIQVG